MPDSGAELRKELRLWRQIKSKSRDDYGAFSRDPNAGVELETDSVEVWHDVQPFIEYQIDGIRTAAIVTDSLQSQLMPEKGTLDAETLLKTIGEVAALADELSERIRQRDMWVPLREVNERAIWKPEGFDGWLRTEPVHAIDMAKFPVGASLHSVDARRPFVVYRRADEAAYRVENRAAYWFDRGSNELLASSAPLEYLSDWDSERMQATFDGAYVLLCDGIVRDVWGESIVERLQNDGAEDAVVFVIADGVAEEVNLYADSFTTIMLPAPLDHVHHKDGSIDRPVLRHMAELFGGAVVRLWTNTPDSAEVEPDWGAIGDSLGRCEIAQIDRLRTVLVSARAPVDADVASNNCFPLTICVYSQPASEKEPLAKSEMRVRKRIEFEDGAAAGGGAMFYWLASRLDGDSLAIQIMKNALREPLHQLVRNIDVSRSRKLFKQMQRWIESSDRPTHTFMIDARREWTGQSGLLSDPAVRQRVTLLEHDPPIILGDMRDLNNITPMPQLARLLPEAVSAAARVVMLKLAARS